MNHVNHIHDNSILSISSPSIQSCNDVAEYLKKAKLLCHVTSNVSVVCVDAKKEQYEIENGCQIKFGSHHTYLVNPLFWSKLKQQFGLECAHLHIEGKFKGCIYDYFRHSTCPHYQSVKHSSKHAR